MDTIRDIIFNMPVKLFALILVVIIFIIAKFANKAEDSYKSNIDGSSATDIEEQLNGDEYSESEDDTFNEDSDQGNSIIF